MNFVTYKNKQVFLKTFMSALFMIVLFGCSATSPQKYSQLDFFDLVSGAENTIHYNRTSILNREIESTNAKISFYENKIKATKEAIDNVKIEVASYDSLIEDASNRVRHINQLHGFLNQVDMRINSIENEFDRVKKISKGLEKITYSEFSSLKNKGYFSDLTWSDYLEIVEEVIEAKKKIDRDLKEARNRTRYARSNPRGTFKSISGSGGKIVWKIFKRLNPIGRIINAVSLIGSWIFD